MKDNKVGTNGVQLPLYWATLSRMTTFRMFISRVTEWADYFKYFKKTDQRYTKYTVNCMVSFVNIKLILWPRSWTFKF